MAFEDSKTAAIAETKPDMPAAVVAPVEITEKPKKPVANQIDCERI